MKLTLNHQSIKNCTKTGRHTTNEKGLQLLVNSSGKKYWILRFSINGKRNDMSLGSFPEVSIKEVYKRILEVRTKIANGIDPIQQKKTYKNDQKALNIKKITFDEFSEEVILNKQAEWTNEKHKAQWFYTIKEFASPIIGNKTLDEVTLNDILEILRPIWHTKTETASRLRGRLEWIFAAAITKGLRKDANPALWRGSLQTILPMPKKISKVKHHKALPYSQVPYFMDKLRNIDSIVALMLEFLILNANRTSEVLYALKSEVNEDGIWIIPSDRMKAKKEHRVPLNKRSIEILSIAKSMDKDSRYLFSRNGKPLSNMAMSKLLKRLGIDVTVHGFRSTFRDWVSEETNHSSEVAEMALAHTISNRVEASYRRGDLLEKRKALLEEWERFTFSKIYKNVLPIKAA